MKHIVFRQFFRDFCSIGKSKLCSSGLSKRFAFAQLLSVALLVLFSAGCNREDGLLDRNGGRKGDIVFQATSGAAAPSTKSRSLESSDHVYKLYYDFSTGRNIAASSAVGSASPSCNGMQSSDTKFSGEVFEITVGSETLSSERLDWEVGDRLTIGECVGSNYSSYAVKTVQDPSTSSPERRHANLMPANGNGLQWQDGSDHKFVALYPSIENLGISSPSVTFSVVGGKNTMQVAGDYDVMPSLQYCYTGGTRNYKSPKVDGVKYPNGRPEVWYAPDMRYAYMIAKKEVLSTAPKDITTLSFYPYFSSVEVKLFKPASLKDNVVTLNSAVLKAGSGVASDASITTPANIALTGTTDLVSSICWGATDGTSYETPGGCIEHSYTSATAGNSITLKFRSNRYSGTDITPELTDQETGMPLSFTFLTLPVNITQLSLTLSLNIDGVPSTHTINLQTVSTLGGTTTKSWISLPPGKKLTISNMETFDHQSMFVEKAFSVSDDHTVVFSPGNLWATLGADENYSTTSPPPATWSFAPHQYDMPTSIQATAGSTIDIFYYSAGNSEQNSGGITNRNLWGIQTGGHGAVGNTVCDFYDWGKNTITWNGITYSPNTYRTPTIDEWNYILNERTGSKAGRVGSFTDCRYSYVKINGTNGVILYPDGFVWDETVMGSVPNQINTMSMPTNFALTEYNLVNWSYLESAGVVFLPLIGHRTSAASIGGMTGINNALDVFYRSGNQACYWASSTLFTSSTNYLCAAEYSGYFSRSDIEMTSYSQGVRVFKEFTGAGGSGYSQAQGLGGGVRLIKDGKKNVENVTLYYRNSVSSYYNYTYVELNNEKTSATLEAKVRYSDGTTKDAVVEIVDPNKFYSPYHKPSAIELEGKTVRRAENGYGCTVLVAKDPDTGICSDFFLVGVSDGYFHLADGTKVEIAPGNLQAAISNGNVSYWRMGGVGDYIGDTYKYGTNGNAGTAGANANQPSASGRRNGSGFVDLFAWSGEYNRYGIDLSPVSYSFVDYSSLPIRKYNSFETYEPGYWVTPTQEQWAQLFDLTTKYYIVNRKVPKQLRSIARFGYNNGTSTLDTRRVMFLLPDGIIDTEDFQYDVLIGSTNNAGTYALTKGAVVFPSGGMWEIGNTNLTNPYWAYYWSSSTASQGGGVSCVIMSQNSNANYYVSANAAQAANKSAYVRLIHLVE